MFFNLIEESKKLISLRSISEEGTMDMVRHLLPYCRQLGFNIVLQGTSDGDPSREVNLIAYTVPEGSTDLCPHGLFLGTHLDTVPPGNPDLWTETGGNPFKATLKKDKLYGLGSADTKLDFLCKLLAIERVGLKNIKIPLALVGTFGEERALAGARLLRETGILHPKFALVSEPSELQPVVAHKGILYLRAIWEAPSTLPTLSTTTKSFKGRAAHGSMPHLGENAILKAFQWIFEEEKKKQNLQLLKIKGGTVHNVVPESCEVSLSKGTSPCPRLRFLRVFSDFIKLAQDYLATHENKDFDPPHTSFNIGVIHGNTSRIEIEFDFRLIPETDGNTLFEIFQGLAQEIPEARVEVIRSNTPMATSKNSEIVKKVKTALREVGLPVRFLSKSGNTEGAVLSEMGAEAIVIGPGRSVGNIHAPNEYNEISQLEKAVDFYAAFLKQFC